MIQEQSDEDDVGEVEDLRLSPNEETRSESVIDALARSPAFRSPWLSAKVPLGAQDEGGEAG